MENPIHVATFKTLGAYPVPMPFGELFTALQQKTVDGQENPLIIISTSKFSEVQKYLSLTGHFYAPAILLINKDVWEKKMTEDQRKIFTEAELKSREWERNFCIESEKTLVDSLKAAGMEVAEPDKAKFFEVLQPVYAEFEAKVGKERIQSLVDAQK
jgi:TRAP-type C4-dicarboxylate transport system substrate-binding protein